MENNQDVFELEYKDAKINVQRHLIAKQTIYRVLFSDKRNPLIITTAVTNKEDAWWTSLPEGRQQEAEELGAIIANYLQINQ